jgi:hypothetical protein
MVSIVGQGISLSLHFETVLTLGDKTGNGCSTPHWLEMEKSSYPGTGMDSRALSWWHSFHLTSRLVYNHHHRTGLCPTCPCSFCCSFIRQYEAGRLFRPASLSSRPASPTSVPEPLFPPDTVGETGAVGCQEHAFFSP